MNAKNNSQHEVSLIKALLHDVYTSHGAVFNAKSLKDTIGIVDKRTSEEGIGFLTKTLPKLGKALDRALSGSGPLKAVDVGFVPMPGCEYPLFLGELFSQVLHSDGTALINPVYPDDPYTESSFDRTPDKSGCFGDVERRGEFLLCYPKGCSVKDDHLPSERLIVERSVVTSHVRMLRQLLYCFYKYELEYSSSDEQRVVDQFVKTEVDLRASEEYCQSWRTYFDSGAVKFMTYELNESRSSMNILRRARITLQRVLRGLDLDNIPVKHGPGVVSTKEKPWDKYMFRNVSDRITNHYAYDDYFCASLGHVCDIYGGFGTRSSTSHPAKVLLVPKDSRGPRLISCEPLDNQWIQQGIRAALYERVEKHRLTRDHVFFTDQQPNRDAAQNGSCHGKLATLDLKEASDRVGLELVRLLFPSEIVERLECCRSEVTVLPGGAEIKLKKFAPMGSALCFPIMALVIWAILDSATRDKDVRESILVYGDDVIVPTAFAADAITALEMVGLLVNQEKSCTKGFFRESCGMDAYSGVDVTPVKIKTVWTSVPSPDSFVSWIEYANSLYGGKYYAAHDYIVGRLSEIYKPIATREMVNSPVRLKHVPDESSTLNPGPKVPSRYNSSLQRMEYYATEVESRAVKRTLPGWNMLLRYFTETTNLLLVDKPARFWDVVSQRTASLSVSKYTVRGTSKLVRRWR